MEDNTVWFFMSKVKKKGIALLLSSCCPHSDVSVMCVDSLMHRQNRDCSDEADDRETPAASLHVLFVTSLGPKTN